jgi:hypothetical protein
MDIGQSETLIGYSIFEVSEECWQYNENACFIAATRSGAEAFLRDGWTPADDCRIEAVCLADILRDFGCSGGEYAIEREAFLRFQQLAEVNGVRFEAEPYDGDDSLLVVNIDGIVRHDDE